MAVMTLASEVDSGITPAEPYLVGDEMDKDITIVGWGSTGNATD